MSAGGQRLMMKGALLDLPGGVKLHQDCIFALHEGLKVAIGENHHAVLFFHLGVIFIFLVLLIITFLSGLLPLLLVW